MVCIAWGPLLVYSLATVFIFAPVRGLGSGNVTMCAL